MLMRMEPLWWQYMQSKLPMTLGRAFLAAFFADLRLPMDSLPPRSPTNYAEQENRFRASIYQFVVARQTGVREDAVQELRVAKLDRRRL